MRKLQNGRGLFDSVWSLSINERFVKTYPVYTRCMRHSRIPLLFRNLSILGKSVSDKSYKLKKDLFIDLINLGWRRQDCQVKVTSIFKNRIPYF